MSDIEDIISRIEAIEARLDKIEAKASSRDWPVNKSLYPVGDGSFVDVSKGLKWVLDQLYINKISDLEKYTAEELIRKPGVGRKRINEIKDIFKSKGLSLREAKDA